MNVAARLAGFAAVLVPIFGATAAVGAAGCGRCASTA